MNGCFGMQHSHLKVLQGHLRPSATSGGHLLFCIRRASLCFASVLHLNLHHFVAPDRISEVFVLPKWLHSHNILESPLGHSYFHRISTLGSKRIADHLAGEASSYLLALLGEDEDDLGDIPEDFPILCDPPYELLLRENAIIAGPHKGGKVALILTETISCDHYWMTKMCHVEGWATQKTLPRQQSLSERYQTIDS